MHDSDVDSLRAAIAALEAQRAVLGDAVLELATAPLRARLAGLLHPSGLQLRQVTVLFADVVGSTAMAQGLRAEDTLDVLGRAMHRMADIVQAHQGRVLRFTGDGVKAAFGMDEAREDDAERAVRMKRCNPKFVLRNHLAETAIERAREGDFNEVQRLLNVLQHPFDEQPEHEADAGFPPAWAQTLEISCSS